MSRIMIIHPEGNINNNPNLTGIVEILCEKGHGVDIYSPRLAHMQQCTPCRGANFILADTNPGPFSSIITVFPVVSLKSTETINDYITCNIPRYDLVIGVDRGIIEASIIARQQKVPYGLISYEILFSEETGIEHVMADRDASQGASFAVCQDRIRSSHLSRENGIPLERIIDIPVAGRTVKRGIGIRNFALHEKLGLAQQTKIALYIGGVTYKWAGIDELIECSDQWPDDWVLVLHQRYSIYDQELTTRFSCKQKQNIFLSPFPNIPFDKLHILLNAADLGLGFYVPQFQGHGFSDRNNLKYIGMASGKISTYLQHGLPIVINEIGEMSEYVRNYKLGRIVTNFSDLGHLLGSIDNNELSAFNDNCYEFFRSHLDLNVTIQPFLNIISNLISHSTKQKQILHLKDRELKSVLGYHDFSQAANNNNFQLPLGLSCQTKATAYSPESSFKYWQPPAGVTERFITVQPRHAECDTSSAWQALKTYEVTPFGQGFPAIEHIIAHIITTKLRRKPEIPQGFWSRVIAVTVECDLLRPSGQPFIQSIESLADIDPAFLTAEGPQRAAAIQRYAELLRQGQDLGIPLYITGAALMICGGDTATSESIFMVDGARRISASVLSGKRSVKILLLMTEDEYSAQIHPDTLLKLQRQIEALSWFNQYQSIPLVGIRGERSLTRFALMDMPLLRDQVVMDFGCNLGQACIKAIMAGAREVWGVEGMPDTYRIASEIRRLSGFPNLRYLNIDFNATEFNQQIDSACPGQVDYSFFFSVYRTKELTQRDRLFKYIIDKTTKGIFFEGHADPKIDTLEYYSWLFESFGLTGRYLGNSEGKLRPLFYIQLAVKNDVNHTQDRINYENNQNHENESSRELNGNILVAVNLVPTGDNEWKRRQESCIRSIDMLRTMRICPLNVCYPDEVIEPDGWSVAPVLAKSANHELSVSGKRKPFVNDLFSIAAQYAVEINCPWFAYSNNDIILTSKLIETVQKLMVDGYETVAVSRNEIEQIAPDGHLVPGYLEYRGFDVFFVKTSWWLDHKGMFQPYIVGERAWDDAYAAIMLCNSHGTVLYKDGMCLHHKHETAWLAGGYAEYNLSLYNGPDKQYQERLRSFVDDVGQVGTKKLSDTMLNVLIEKYFKNSWNGPHNRFVNIGMVTYNRLEFTRQAIAALVSHTDYPYVLTVIDNYSQDCSKEYLIDLKKQGIIKNLVLLNENVGVAKASNLAWSLEPEADYYIKLDNDIVIQKPGWLKQMVDAVDRIPLLGAVAYNFEPDSYPLQEIDDCSLRPKRGNLGGACILIPRRTRERLGVWCEDYGVYSEEDADYGWRIISSGLVNAYMEDEHIGLHLPAGRAAAIDATTFTAADGVEEEMHSDYRKWKDDQRRKAISGGLRERNFTRYANDPSSLYVESHFAADWLLHHRPSDEQQFSASAGISSTQKLKSIPRIGVLCSDPLSCSCPVIRVVSPLKHLQDRGFLTYVDISPLLQGTQESLMNKLQQFDILVVQRDVCWNVPYTSLKPLLDKTRIKLVFEFDDAMTSLPASNPHYEHYMSRRHLFEDYIRNADLVTVSTPYLKEIYSSNNSKIQVLPNYIDTKIWPSWQMKHNVASIPLKILFSGTPTHVADFNIVLKAIERILEEFQDGVELYLWGNKIPALFGHPRVHYVEEYVCEYGEYARILQNLNADIGLIPLEINTFNRAKSAIKWLEYSACGIASICSDIDAYNRIVSNGNTGLLVSNDESNWYEAIKSLVLNNELRIRIAENAQLDVATNYTIETNADKWIETYNRLLNKPSHANNHEQKVFISSTLKVSIIIPVFNQLSYTVRCLEALYAVTPSNAGFEIIVVDNASTDGTAEFLFQATQRYGNLRIIQNIENLLFAKACNQGGEAAHGGYLVFLNNDTVVTPDWLEAMLEVCQPDVGIVGIRMLYPDGTIQHAGIELINGIPDHPYRHQPADMPAANIPRDLDMVTGACLLISRDLFLQLGGFDEVYRNGVEDVDLCLRVREAGYRVLYQPKAMIYHHEGQSSGRFDHVDHNLSFFINRWQGKFDKKGHFITANPPIIMTAEKSYLIDQRLHIVWQGSQFVYHSLALVNRELCQRLIQIGHELSIVPYEPDEFVVEPESPLATIQNCINRPLSQRPDVVVRHQWPPDFNPPPVGHWVMIQPWEFGSLPQSWIMPMNDEVDEIWVPSSFVRECYIQSGVSADKVFVIPNGVDTLLFSPEGTTYPIASGKSFRFLFVGGTIYRKGIDLLLAAYRQSFTAQDDVCLVIKDMGGKSFYQGQTAQEMIQRFSADSSAPEIVYIDGSLTQDEMAALYRSCHCLVHPYRGEGFGLPIAEAMACGLAPIVTGYGAALDFCPPEYAWLIPAKIVNQAVKQIGDLETVDFPWLAEPDLEMLTTLMRYAAAHPQETVDLGGCASRFIRNKFTWKQAADRTDERLRAVTNKPIQRFVALACEKHHETASGFVSPVKINSKFDMPLNPKEPIGIYDRLAEGGKESVSLCMIVKNEEHNLGRCLESIKPVVHEIIVVDTGSTDKTVEIATSFGARVFNFSWNGNFSDARNYAIKQAKGNWIFVMDADEVFSELDYDAFRSVFAQSKGKELAWAVTTRNYMADSMQHGWTANSGEYPQEERGIGWCPSPKTRLFPRNKRIRFAGPVHEVVEHSLKRLKIHVLHAPFVVHHYGHLNKTGIESKKQQYYELAKKKVLSRSDDPDALSELAVQAGEVGRFEEAIELWEQVLKIRQNDTQAYFNRSHALNHLKRYHESIESAKQALKIDPSMKEAAFYYATGKLYVGDLSKAEAELLRILAIHNAYPPALALLAVIRLCRGDSEAAQEQVALLKQINFTINKFIVDCIRKLADVRRTNFARNLLQLSVQIGCLPKEALVELDGCTVAQGRTETDDVLTNRTLDDELVLRTRIMDQAIAEACRLAMRGEIDRAIEEILQKGIRVSQENPAPYWSLIDILLADKRFQDALQVITEMPKSTPATTIIVMQAVCQEGVGEYDQARKNAEKVLNIEPGNWRALNVLGLIAHRNGILDIAAEYFERAIKANPDAAEPAANRGVIWWETGNQPSGYELLKRGATLALQDEEIFRRYRSAAIALGREEEAERLFRDKLSNYPESRLLAISLVESLITQGKTSEALDEILVALSTLGADGELLDGALELRRQIGPPKPLAGGEQQSASLCMIVKNEAANLPRCLASVTPVVQEMVIVDTGSSDRTVDIATAYGAQACSFSWTGSFSDARNFGLSKAQGQWILVMDADEVLSAQDYDAIRRAVQSSDNSATAWSVLTRNYTTRVNSQGWIPNDHAYPSEERADGWHPSRKVRLFPNDRQIRFRGEVHEMVEHDLRQLGYTINPAAFVVHHYGELFGVPEELSNKMRRYFDQGKQKLEEQPNDVIALTELAVQAGELDLFEEALLLWDRALALQPDTVEALFNKGYALIGLKRYQEGLDASRRALEGDPDHKEAAFNFGTCALYTDDPYTAITVVAPVLARHPDYPLLLALMTVLYLVTGQHDRARTTYTKLESLTYAIADYIRDRAKDLEAVGRNDMARHLRKGGMLMGIDHSVLGGTDE